MPLMPVAALTALPTFTDPALLGGAALDPGVIALEEHAAVSTAIEPRAIKSFIISLITQAGASTDGLDGE